MNTRRIQHSHDEYGLDGDGLCKGEVAYEFELSWSFFCLGVFERVAADLREARNTQRSNRRPSRSGGVRDHTRSARGGERRKRA